MRDSGVLSHEWDVFNTPRNSGIYERKKVERFKNQGSWHVNAWTYEITEIWIMCARFAEAQAKTIPIKEERSRYKVPYLNKKLFTSNSCWERKSPSFLSQGSDIGCINYTPEQTLCSGEAGRQMPDVIILIIFSFAVKIERTWGCWVENGKDLGWKLR